MRTIMFVVGLLLAAPSVALQITRGDAVRSILSAASGAFVALTPLAVVADRGKDLYESDRSILSGGGEINTNVALPEYDSEGRMIDAKGYEEETTMRVLQQGKASVQVLKTWTQSADGTWHQMMGCGGETLPSSGLPRSASVSRRLSSSSRPIHL